MLYRNPIRIKGHEDDPLGDPFIYRWIGEYYLFVSTENREDKICCYKSSDLVNWVFDKTVASDPLLIDAYAPEVVYAYNRFFLVTSPQGSGHYIFVSSKIDGPYKRLTDNLGSMIDGSFYVDKASQLHLLRADHNGIAILDVSEEGNLSNRRNIPVRLGAWTEGPGLFHRGDYYYLTYCGNNLFSKGYRVAYATSKEMASSYRFGINNPLLIHTGKGATRLGHSSTVLAPDLDGYYVAYHAMDLDKDTYKPRRLHIDRARFSGRLMSVNASKVSLKAPLKPDFAVEKPFSDKLFLHEKTFILAQKKLPVEFTLETTFSGLGTSLVFGYVDEEHFTELIFEKRNYSLVEHRKGDHKIAEGTLAFDFAHLHEVRIAVESSTRFIIDNALIAILPSFPLGRFGFRALPDSKIFYTAFSKYSNGSSDLAYPLPLPGLLDASHSLTKGRILFDKDDEIGYKCLKKDIFEYVAKKGRYALNIFARVSNEAKLLVNGKRPVLKRTLSEYDWLSYGLGDYDLETKGALSLKLLSGTLDYKFIEVDAYEKLSIKDTFIHKGKTLLAAKGRDSYFLGNVQSSSFHLSVKFTLKEMNPFGTFGLVLGAHEYSNHCFQARYPLEGYLVGFEGSLLVIDRFDYSKTRIFDRPTDIKEGEEHFLEAALVNGAFTVSLDNKILIITTVSDPAHLGTSGLFASDDCNVQLSEVQ